jgi:SfnB family sulfur acquisition oxidoreductase
MTSAPIIAHPTRSATPVNLPRPRPLTPAHVIRTADEAIRIAKELASTFAEQASVRDREQRLPLDELDAFSQSGLWGITVPREYGGAGLGYRTITEVIRIVSAADPSLGQIPQNHLCLVDAIASDGSEAQKRLFFGEVLKGLRFGNAFSEAHSRTVTEFETKLTPEGDGYRIDGRKFYATGALLAHVVPVVAVDAEKRGHLAFLDRDAPGLKVIDDWSSFGQRTTASGSVILDGVWVPASHVIPAYRAFERPTAAGPISQIIQAAVDAGIAEAAIQDTIQFVRRHTRPWTDSGQEHGWEDPFTIHAIGDLEVRFHAAETMLGRAADKVDRAVLVPDEHSVAAASIAVAEAKALTTEIAILATNKLFELAGTSSTLARHGLDRHWRNARVHTLHDPVRWKYFHIGNYALNDIRPPRHPWL